MKERSPIKVKDYFTNPIHKIRQPSFTSINFNQSTLNTFVKAFTNRSNSNYISYNAIREFIKSFTNNSYKLMSMYENFFVQNFKRESNGDILLDHFIQFFTREENQNLSEFDEKQIRLLYKDFGQMNLQSFMEKCEELGIGMTQKEAKKIILQLNGDGQGKKLTFESFRNAIKSIDK